MKHLDWLKKNQKYVSVSAIGEELEIKDTLLKAVNGTRKLPEKHEKKLTEFINNLIKL